MADRNDVIIIGSGPAGLTAALYTARANLKPILIEGFEAGGQLMLTTLVENWPGFRDGIMGPDLIADIRAQAERFGTRIIRGQVKSVDLRSRPFTVTLGDAEYSSRSLIIATGASARLLGLRVRARAARATASRRARPATATSSAASRSRSSAAAIRRWRRRSSSRASPRTSPSCIGATRSARRRSCRTRRSPNAKISFEWNTDVDGDRRHGEGGSHRHPV